MKKHFIRGKLSKFMTFALIALVPVYLLCQWSYFWCNYGKIQPRLSCILTANLKWNPCISKGVFCNLAMCIQDIYQEENLGNTDRLRFICDLEIFSICQVIRQNQHGIFILQCFYRPFWGNVLFSHPSQNEISEKKKPYRYSILCGFQYSEADFLYLKRNTGYSAYILFTILYLKLWW